MRSDDGEGGKPDAVAHAKNTVEALAVGGPFAEQAPQNATHHHHDQDNEHIGAVFEDERRRSHPPDQKISQRAATNSRQHRENEATPEVITTL